MKVDIKHYEKTEGLFKKRTYYCVDLTVVFSEEEKQIIEDADLGSVVLMERGVPPDRNPNSFKNIEDVFNLRIHSLVVGTNSYAFLTPKEAKEYDQELREVLPKLKSFIADNAPEGRTSTSFEI